MFDWYHKDRRFDVSLVSSINLKLLLLLLLAPVFTRLRDAFLEFSSSKVALDGVLQCTPGKIKNFISIASSIIKLLLKWPRRCEWRVRSAEKASV